MYDIVTNDPENAVNRFNTKTGRVKPDKIVPFATTSARISTAETQHALDTPGPGTYKTAGSFITKTYNKTFF